MKKTFQTFLGIIGFLIFVSLFVFFDVILTLIVFTFKGVFFITGIVIFAICVAVSLGYGVKVLFSKNIKKLKKAKN